MTLVGAMQRDGHGGIGRARALLDCLIESQDLPESYRQRVLIAIERNKL
jgi:hypothetical protein